MSDIALKYDAKAEAFDFVLPGDQRTAPVELINDGTFVTVGSWLPIFGADALQIDAGRLKVIEAAGANTPARAYRSFPVIAGHTYGVSVTVVPVSATATVAISSDGSTHLTDKLFVFSSGSAQQVLSGAFTADFSGNHYAYLMHLGVTGAGNYCLFDNLSIKDTSDRFQSTRFNLDSGLESAVILSLYCDRRAAADDPIPDGTRHRRGWWADAHARVEGDLIGSRMWLVDRSKVQAQVLLQAREYAIEALRWLIEDGIARAVDVQVSVIKSDVLGIDITIKRLDGGTFRKLWELQLRPR